MRTMLMLHFWEAGSLVFLGLLACYGLYRYYLLWLYYRVKSRRPVAPPAPSLWPSVTIQIPIYNERYVIERTIRSACEVDYPAQQLEIQLLDDSTDETSAIIARMILPYQQRGLRVVHLKRAHRQHYKAGALAQGLRHAQGDFVAVFDADFVIPRDFLIRAMPFFTDPRVGMVQARWGHVNAAYSLLTRTQAALLDGHFVIEQVARHQAGRFFNFNGTAGIWRKQAIETSGGWQTDTLTEDLDLSYRAQLKGWKGIFLADLVAPAELPVEMDAFKSQQYRWTKGSIQTAKKLLHPVFSSRLPWSIKWEAFCHLTAYFSYPIGLLASLGVAPMLMGTRPHPHHWPVDALWLVLLAIPGMCFYLCAQRELAPKFWKRVLLVPWVVVVGVGMSVNNAVAVLDALLGGRSEFLRTPKFCVESQHDRWDHKQYRATGTATAWAELALALYFGIGCLQALHRHLFLAVPSLVVFCAGFGYVGGLSLWQRWALSMDALRSSPAPAPTLEDSTLPA